MGAEQAGRQLVDEQALQLPSTPAVTAHMSDVEAIDAIFGEHRSALERIDRARTNRNAKVRGASAGLSEQSEGTRWGLNPDPEQRATAYKLLIFSALLLMFLLAVKIGC